MQEGDEDDSDDGTGTGGGFVGGVGRLNWRRIWRRHGLAKSEGGGGSRGCGGDEI